MAVTLEKFVKQLEESGILAGDTIQDFLPPKSEPRDAMDLARELVRQKKLTRFQVEEVSRGNGSSLTLGNYVLLEKIGAGGMGQVFKARHRRMHRTVAVKLLPANMTKDAAAIARFEREVTAAARLRHPNIVAADDADCANGVHFLVLELVEGDDLSALVKKHGRSSIADAVNFILQAARGLEYAHAEGVVHRDIKPVNLLLDKKGTVKILDMGLARIHSDAPGQAELTSTGTVMGTVDYMAPEQALSTKTADARADIYSLGCSLYYLLTAQAAYDGDTLMSKLLAHRDHPIPVLRTLRPEIPELVEAVFKKMVAKKVEDRFQTMTEVISALEQCGCGQPGRLPSQTLDSPTKSERGNPLSTSTMVLVPPTTAAVVKPNALSPRQPADSPAEANFDFLEELAPARARSLRTERLAKPSGKHPKNALFKDRKRLILIGGRILGGLLLLAGIVLSLQTRDGTLVVTIDQPDAIVQVLDAKGQVEISQPGGNGKVTISVDTGKHRLKVEKDGFALFTREFEIESGGKQSISASLVPAADKAAVVGAGPAREVATASQAEGSGWVSLFNGKDLEGWKPQPGDEAKWEVRDGILVGSGPGAGHLFSERDDCVNFHFKIEAKINDLGNGGQYFRATFGPGFPPGYEVQINSTQPDAKTGSLYGLAAVPDMLVKPDEWFTQEVIAEGNHIIILINGSKVVDYVDMENRFTRGHLALQHNKGASGKDTVVEFRKIEVREPPVSGEVSQPRSATPVVQGREKEDNVPPEGYTALFNGTDLTGWKGLVADPPKRAKMSPEQLMQAQGASDAKAKAHWKVVDGVIVFDGKGENICTARDYGDFELYVDFKIAATGDSGIYLRGSPQVQIWDPAEHPEGSGGLFNNQKNPSKPNKVADKPVGQWNTIFIKMVGDKVTVKLNGELVVDSVTMENYWERDKPMYPTGAIELQNHRSPLYFKNIYIKELPGST